MADYLYDFIANATIEGNIGQRIGGQGQPSGDDLRINNGLQATQTIPAVLTGEQCARIIADAESAPLLSGRVASGRSVHRECSIAWIEPVAANHWLFQKLAVLFAAAGRTLGIEVSGLLDPIQYTVYTPGQHFHWHMDLGPGNSSLRKISLTLQLSEDKEYRGGALEFAHAPDLKIARGPGNAILFPAYMAHRITPVESGIRRALVAWACGPAYR